MARGSGSPVGSFSTGWFWTLKTFFPVLLSTFMFRSVGPNGVVSGHVVPTNIIKGKKRRLQIWTFVRQIASGLEHIHAAGVLHLDVKPDNVFLDAHGDLKIGDFGLAVLRKQWDWEEGDGAYVAPELLKDSEPSPASDMYSFGAMLYEVAAGQQLPRSGPPREGAVALPPGRSDALTRLVRMLLHRQPELRPTASEVLARCL